MQLIALPLLAAAAAAAFAVPNSPQGIPQGAIRGACGDKIAQVREAANQPPLDRSPAVPGEGYLIAAVDKRVDGCAVMQMHGNVNDLRPIPEPTLGPARLLPAR